ncbi:DUF669 domain-containing protein [Bacillus pseudomycoides]|uniref:DUF669 domain-containing protein n=1 Tax=Bacillus pseudomycoides TaxID=64104 RepID=UPI00349EA912
MSFFKFDESKVVQGGGLIEEGEYEVTITDAEPKRSTSNKDMIVVTYEVRSDVKQKFQGWKLNYNNFIIESDNKFTNTLLYACGWSDDNQPDFRDLRDMAQQLIGKNLMVKVVHEEYKDRDGNKRQKGVAKFTARSKVSVPTPTKPAITVGDGDLPF